MNLTDILDSKDDNDGVLVVRLSTLTVIMNNLIKESFKYNISADINFTMSVDCDEKWPHLIIKITNTVTIHSYRIEVIYNGYILITSSINESTSSIKNMLKTFKSEDPDLINKCKQTLDEMVSHFGPNTRNINDS